MSVVSPSSGVAVVLASTLRTARLACLTIAWLAALVAIITAQPSGPAATTGAIAFGLFILLTVTRLRWDSLVILTLLATVTWALVESVPGPAEILAGGERVLILLPCCRQWRWCGPRP